MDGCAATMPSLLRLPSGRLLLAFMRETAPGAGQALLMTSDDEGRSWSSPVPITPPGTEWKFLNDGLLRLGTGRLLLPAQHDGLGCLAWISDDDGLTWRMSAAAVMPKGGAAGRVPSLAELPAGRVGMFLRGSDDSRNILIASSPDGDADWRIENEWGPVALDTPCLARRLPESGEILLLWHNHCIPANLTCAVSGKPFRFWDRFHVLEEQERWPLPRLYRHPSMAISRGCAHMTYVEEEPLDGSRSAQRLVYRRLPLAWLLAEPERRAMAFDARTYVKNLWEQAPADTANEYLRTYATASFNPADVAAKPPEGQP
jgi:hypothetical protein